MDTTIGHLQASHAILEKQRAWKTKMDSIHLSDKKAPNSNNDNCCTNDVSQTPQDVNEVHAHLPQRGYRNFQSSQARDGKALEPVEHLALERRVDVELARRAEDRDARVAPLVDDVALVREVRRAARLDVRLEDVPHEPREHPLVARRVRAVVDRRVVHVHDHAIRQEGPGGGGERLDEVGGEFRVDLGSESGAGRRVGLERCVRHLGAGHAREGRCGDAIASGFARSATVRDDERR